MGIELKIKKEVSVIATTFRVHAKLRDEGSYTLLDQDGQIIVDRDDVYVPCNILPESGGDYLVFDVDLETGQIKNWKKPSAKAIQEFINEDDDD